jgi:hypothetical protein
LADILDCDRDCFFWAYNHLAGGHMPLTSQRQVMVSVVSFQPSTRQFSVEEAPPGAAEPELSLETLKQRVRQQEMLADFGVIALKGTPFPALLDHAARLVADGLKAEFAKVLKYLPAENRFLVCAGVGWGPDVVGSATVGADMASTSKSGSARPNCS